MTTETKRPNKPKTDLVLVDAPSSPAVNDVWRVALDAILDNRKLVSLKHASIAMTVSCYAKPAEQASKKQMYRVLEALELLAVGGYVPASIIPTSLRAVPTPKPTH